MALITYIGYSGFLCRGGTQRLAFDTTAETFLSFRMRKIVCVPAAINMQTIFNPGDIQQV